MIYKFTDFREFIKAFYQMKKASRVGFSYRTFATLAGFGSPSFIQAVMDGKKNLSKSSLLKLCKAMELDENAAEYFEHIVFFSQSKTFEEKKFYLEKIDKFHLKNNPISLTPNDYQYLKEWYHPVVREMVELMGFKESPEEMSKGFLFPVTATQVKKSLEFLIGQGFIERQSDSILRKKDKTLSTGEIKENEIVAVIVRAFHKKFAELGVQSIDKIPADVRKTTNTTLSFSRTSYETALERINALRFELLELASAEKNPEEVYQLHINMFPLTKKRKANGDE